MKHFLRLIVTVAIALTCLIPAQAAQAGLFGDADTYAEATIYSTTNPDVALGYAQFQTTDEGLQVQASLLEVPPGNHGFHIHTTGSCANGGKAAGSHFNPDEVSHGYLPADGFDDAHAGDLGNIAIGEDGSGILTLEVSNLSLTSGEYAIADRAVILHAEADDFGQPTGNAGDRIGCGVIQLSLNAQ
ncbi:superoxide dismutase family protein [Sphaerothrix gracilis]|uniref:superoxide dismutase family protein n=1 Tax=Sphaerothrix gracilis TaxID=3151835 RepID=UPI0031FC1CE9